MEDILWKELFVVTLPLLSKRLQRYDYRRTQHLYPPSLDDYDVPFECPLVTWITRLTHCSVNEVRGRM